jgi:hypothetical protein
MSQAIAYGSMGSPENSSLGTIEDESAVLGFMRALRSNIPKVQ